jgi:ATP-dependent DNA helicase PIF1
LLDFLKKEKRIKKYTQSLNKDHAYIITIVQVPLKIAFAASIHSSQGSSIDLLEVDIGMDIFEYGQAYVALSRATSLDGLRLSSFDRTRIMAHPEVLKKFPK